MKHSEKAVELFKEKYHCAQSVFAAFADEHRISVSDAYDIAACFGSGMRKGEVCGSCTGALMVLGAKYARGNTNKDYMNALTDKFLDAFRKANGSCICNELLGVDISTAEGAEAARSKGLFAEFCPKMIVSAAEILDEIIAEEK